MAVDVFATWFLGNMFMDRYLIIHNMESADDIGGKYRPRIGVYDKKANDIYSNSVDDSFLQWKERHADLFD